MDIGFLFPSTIVLMVGVTATIIVHRFFLSRKKFEYQWLCNHESSEGG